MNPLLPASVLATGIAAGLCDDRSIVQLPAFRRTGLKAWVAFSRHADLENGLYFYPLLAIGGSLLTIGAAWTTRRERATSPRARHLADAAAVAAFGAIAATTQAAPNMWRLRRVDDDDAATLERSYRGFRFWHGVRSVAFTAAFAFGVAALSVRR